MYKKTSTFALQNGAYVPGVITFPWQFGVETLKEMGRLFIRASGQNFDITCIPSCRIIQAAILSEHLNASTVWSPV